MESSRFFPRAARVLASLAVVAILGGCVSYDGSKYETVAKTELRLLEDNVTAIDLSACDAHAAAANALRDEGGGSTAWYVPLGAGPYIGHQAFRHERQAAACRGQVEHERSGTITDDQRSRTVSAWARLYRAGLKLTGGI